MATHVVTNQPPPLEDYDLFGTDPVLAAGSEREGAGRFREILSDFGRTAGSGETFRLGSSANAHPPVLVTHDRFGNRRDEVEYHPAWHALMEMSVSNGLHSLPFEHAPGDGARVARDVAFTMISQVEAGHGCPISMTTSIVPALRVQPELAATWEPRLTSRSYDPTFRPATGKQGCLGGMGMTEKQGGSDVRANTTRAVPAGGGGPGGEYRLTGHKWFTSAPMCDVFLVLAQAPDGLSCFLLPRFTVDGSPNAVRLQRLKDKLGNRSNASSELELEDAAAWLVGEEGRGVATIIEMVNHTRLDCVVGSTGLMRQAVAQAAWHVAHRRAFGSKLIDKPLMQNVIADLEIEVEAATHMMLRLSGSFDRAPVDGEEALFRRVATPVAKYWVTKRCTGVVREAMECLGGNGYVEESILPRLFRESPLNAIWEGSGNVIALDAVRAITSRPEALEVFLGGLRTDADRRIAGACDQLRNALTERAAAEGGARRVVEDLALVWAASLLVERGDPRVAEAFLAGRLDGERGTLFGTLPVTTPAIAEIAGRAVPDV